MSQLDYVHFFPSLVWTLIVFVILEGFMLSKFMVSFYSVFRVRRLFMRYLTVCLYQGGGYLVAGLVYYRWFGIGGYYSWFVSLKASGLVVSKLVGLSVFSFSHG